MNCQSFEHVSRTIQAFHDGWTARTSGTHPGQSADRYRQFVVVWLRSCFQPVRSPTAHRKSYKCEICSCVKLLEFRHRANPISGRLLNPIDGFIDPAQTEQGTGGLFAKERGDRRHFTFREFCHTAKIDCAERILCLDWKKVQNSAGSRAVLELQVIEYHSTNVPRHKNRFS